MTYKSWCQMCGHEQSPVEARFSEIFDTCGACGARIIRDPKPEDGLLEEVLLAKLNRAETMVEKLIEAYSFGWVKRDLATKALVAERKDQK